MQPRAIPIFESRYNTMDRSTILEKIERLTSQIQEKENEIQLMKDDLETLRAAIESMLAEDEVSSKSDKEHQPPKAEDPVNEEVASAPPSDSDAAEKKEVEELEAESDPHEAILKTIEDFANRAPVSHIDTDPIGEQRTVAEAAGQQHLNDLHKAMGINERFLYTNELFGGSMQAFSQAVEELNHIESKEDANRLMDESLSRRYKWDEESETVEAFRALVARRFT